MVERLKKPVSKCLVLALFLLSGFSLASAVNLYSTDFEGSESSWGCHSPDQSLDICTTDANDHYVSANEAAKAHRDDGLCGVAGGVSRDFSFSKQPDTIQMEVKAKADNWGSTAIYLKDSNGYHKLWDKYASGSNYETGWMTKQFDISSYEKDFKIIIGNDDDSQYCDNGDHSWWIWADDFEVQEDEVPPEKPSSPEPADDSIISDSSPQISALYQDPEGESGELIFYNSDGSEIGRCSVSSGNRCGVEWSAASHGRNNWYAVARDNSGATNKSYPWSFVINNPPDGVKSVQIPSDRSYITGENIEYSVEVSDPDGDSMSVEFLNNVSNASSSERTVTGISDGGTASVKLQVDRGETYNWWTEVSDTWETTVSGSWGFHVNELPMLRGIQPDDGSVHSNEEVILNASATDSEQDSLTVYFFKDGGESLGKDSGTENELLSSDSWKRLLLGQTYIWDINVSDGYENRTYQDFEFLRSSSQQYRTVQEIDYSFSSLLVPEDSTKIVTVRVTNKVSEPKSLTTYLEGVNAYFDRNGKDSVSYALDGYSSKEFLVVVSPENRKAKKLTVKTENSEIGLNTTDSLSVEIRSADSAGETKNVPGITGVNLLVITLLSVLLYYQRL